MDCLICQEDVVRTGYGISIECGHVFHGKCILEWMKSNQTCPICRTNFTSNSIHPLFLTNTLENDENYRYEIDRGKEPTIYIIPVEVEAIRTQQSSALGDTSFCGCVTGLFAILVITSFIMLLLIE